MGTDFFGDCLLFHAGLFLADNAQRPKVFFSLKNLGVYFFFNSCEEDNESIIEDTL